MSDTTITTPVTTVTLPETTIIGPPESVKTPRKLTPYSIDAILMRAELVTTGHESDPEIQAAMAPFHYDKAAMQKLGAQLTASRAIVAATVQSRGEQKGRTQHVKTDWAVAKDAAATFRLVCSEVLKDEPGALEALGIKKGTAPQALSAFLLYADNLFTNALNAPPSVQVKLATRGYDAARLTAEKQKIEALHAANQAQEQAKGAAQNLTPQQTRTLRELDDAVMLYRKLARRALKARPQLLEKVGVKA